MLPEKLPSEDYAPPTAPTSCRPTPQPGVVAFRDLVLQELGGRNLGIVRSCDRVSATGKLSDHHEGRAWDWGVNYYEPTDVARVEKLFDWLFAGNDDGARWAGITYLIWNGKIWTVKSKQWRPYGGSAHRDHVHISFGWPAAQGDTMLYRYLRGEVSGGGWPVGWKELGVAAVAAGVSYWASR